MSITLKEVLDEAFKDVTFDWELAKKVYRYQIGYINQNREHIQFFGSNLLGVHVVRFKDSDVLRLFDEVLDLDFYDISAKIKTVTTISHDFKIAGDPFNLTCFYILHRFMTSRLLNDKQRHRACYDISLVFFYRCVAAIMSYYFRYPTDPKIAQAAYAELSNKFLIKKLGSWHKVMDYRAEDLISKESIHYKNLLTFTNDTATVYALEDSQGRIKDMIKNYCQEFYKVHGEGTVIATTSSTFLDAEGEETTREKTLSTEKYTTYIRNAVIDKNTFVKDDLVNVILRINSNTSFRIVKTVLTWIADHTNDAKHHKLIDDFLVLSIVQSMHFIENYIEVNKRKDLPYVLTTLKNLYLSTRSSDPELLRTRELGSKIIKATGLKVGNSLALSTRTSIILYIALRAIAGSHN